MTEQEYAHRCVRQHKKHTQIRKDGSKLFKMDHGLYDVFHGTGWNIHSRFRIVKLREDPNPRLIQISGLSLNRETRDQLVKECH